MKLLIHIRLWFWAYILRMEYERARALDKLYFHEREQIADARRRASLRINELNEQLAFLNMPEEERREEETRRAA